MKNFMNSIMVKKPSRNIFDMTHDVKMSTKFGRLTPAGHAECLPGDSWKLKTEKLTRMAPMITPVMHRFDNFSHCFFIACRILWDGWEEFITAQPTGGPAPAFPTVTINSERYSLGLADYLGLPDPGLGSYTVSAMLFAAYQFVYNEYYRDQNLIDAVPYKLVNGDNSSNLELFVLRNRAHEHDYFTSCLPFAQKGAAVEIPLGAITENVQVVYNADSSDTSMSWNTTLNPSATPSSALVPIEDLDPAPDASFVAKTEGLTVGQTTINELRTAERLQQWLEKAARAGSRYFEQILVHFGFKSPDKRLQRPEYITGTKQAIAVSEVLNTTGTEDAPQGNMAGHGIAYTDGYGGSYFCEEHGFILQIDSTRPKTAYQQGIERFWSKTTDFTDYAFPEFANLGEQAVLNKEIYVDHPDPDGTFGYLPRYAENRTIHSRVAGEFKTTLDFWHAGRIFDSPPGLNQAFIEVNPEAFNRIFAVGASDADHLYMHVRNAWSVVRSLPKFGTPTW